MTGVIVYEYQNLLSRVMYHRGEVAHLELRNEIVLYLVSRWVS